VREEVMKTPKIGDDPMNNEWESIDKVIFVISLGRSNTNIFGKDY
jgi:hypothetical protein